MLIAQLPSHHTYNTPSNTISLPHHLPPVHTLQSVAQLQNYEKQKQQQQEQQQQHTAATHSSKAAAAAAAEAAVRPLRSR